MQGLLDRFITAAAGETETPDSALGSLKENNTLLSAVQAAVLLELLPHQTAFEVRDHDNVRIDRVPLLVVAASLALADSENKGNKEYSTKLSFLLRSPLFPRSSFIARLMLLPLNSPTTFGIFVLIYVRFLISNNFPADH